LTGLLTGLGVALADLLYGIFAVFGLFAISGETLESQPVLRLAGALCIMFIGLRMMSKIDVTTNKNISHETEIKDIL
jgi:threonine/homoserine/homoserine lactone efflux protein